jgi:hypothetical protein
MEKRMTSVCKTTGRIRECTIVFLDDQSGAVTVDWVVLTAATVGLGGAVMTSISDGTTKLAKAIADDLGSTVIADYSGVEKSGYTVAQLAELWTAANVGEEAATDAYNTAVVAYDKDPSKENKAILSQAVIDYETAQAAQAAAKAAYFSAGGEQ